MKFSKWLIGAALLASTQITSIYGVSHASCDPCDPCYESKSCDFCDMDFCEVEYDFYIDALYWKLCRSDLDLDGDNDEGDFVCHDYCWGWRLGAIAHYDNWDFGLRYTSFLSDAKNDNGGDAEHDFDYKVLDLEIGRSCCLCDGISFRPLAGAKLAWIEEEFDKSDNNDGSEGKYDLRAYGLYLGFASRWELCSYCVCDTNIPLALVTRATTGVLHGSFDYNIVPDAGDVELKDECLYIRVHDLYVALDMSFCDICGCGSGFFQIGYEVQHWDNVRDWFSDDDIASFGLGGMVLRFGVNF